MNVANRGSSLSSLVPGNSRIQPSDVSDDRLVRPVATHRPDEQYLYRGHVLRAEDFDVAPSATSGLVSALPSQRSAASDSKAVLGTPVTTARVSESSAAPIHSNLSLRSLMGMKSSKMAEYPIDLCLRTTVNGSSATFFAPVTKLQPNDSSVVEASQLKLLFDEAKCVGVTFHSHVSGNTAIGAYAWGTAFDPANDGAYTSVAGILLASQHDGPIAMNQSSTGSVSIIPTNSSGFRIWRAKTMPVAPTSGTTSAGQNVGSNWFSLSDSTPIIGYLKGAIDAVSGSAITLDTFIVYHMLYRSRT